MQDGGREARQQRINPDPLPQVILTRVGDEQLGSVIKTEDHRIVVLTSAFRASFHNILIRQFYSF